ncbi:MAG: cation:proton antiporter, partial [Bacteroidales bacterium]|nr:cation:proton antiporter [Bacteroidales bacterium]
MTAFLHHFLDAFQLPLTNPVLIFSLMLFIILLSPIILRKFKIPSIIGLIIAGILIGPHGFGLLQNNSSIELFSTIGLLYIMFLAGLDLDMNGFKTTRNKSVVFGLLTFLFPLIIGFPICTFILKYDFSTSLLISSMFSTHTLVSYPIVSKFGVAKNQAVAVTVGGTILTDTLVLLILAIILDGNDGSLDVSFFIRMGVSLLIFSLIMFLIVPKIAKWFFQKLESEKHSHYIFVLSVMFFAAFLAEIAGMESIIGAFVAGLVLNRFIPHSSSLMNRIDFIGNALFIPFFLISVGMLVDLHVLIQGPRSIVVAVVLSLSAFAGKWIAAFFTQLVFRFSHVQRRLIFGLSSAHAAATLAIILAGFHVGIINNNVLNGTIILILITCVVSSLVTERAARK